MEETKIEIPEITEESGWQPPIIQQEKTKRRQKTQHCTDVFFVQYVICILLLTGLFAVKIYNESLFSGLLTQFCSQTQAPSEPWAQAAAEQLQDLWS